ncbi:hypothetical protein B0I33_11637 [Prauserella shujinwangii]|uniref:SH3 domain-containing protein n=1 Tax=Prauserella shujinwangii TaxID=1453103 RepID=A0A2T0LKC3_9PSEU|nr:hypothetical protein [Prauserella shujinwangii]PRX43304.1 hypothetical protein B0I33_11637 [Prauserella shujinwangii]
MLLGIPKKTLIIVAVLAGVVLIYALGSGERPSEAESGSAGCRVAVTADVLNVRSGPGLGHGIVGKFQQNAETDAEPLVRNGFRKLAEGRWAADEFLDPVDGARCG